MTDWDKLQKSIIDDYFKDMGLKGKLQLIQKLLKEIERDISIETRVAEAKSP